MKFYKIAILLGVSIILLLNSCWPNLDKVFKENNNKFELHRSTLNNTIREVETTYLPNGAGQDITIPIDSLKVTTQKHLKKLGIGSVEISATYNGGCEKKYRIIMHVVDYWNIGTLRVVQLVFAPCDEHTIKGNHYHDGHHRDFWGQGEHWLIYSDSDFM